MSRPACLQDRTDHATTNPEKRRMRHVWLRGLVMVAMAALLAQLGSAVAQAQPRLVP